jgi:hypothetical protein
LARSIDEVMPFDQVLRTHFRFPLHDGASIALVHELGRVLDAHYSETYCDVEAEVPTSLKQRLARFVN